MHYGDMTTSKNCRGLYHEEHRDLDGLFIRTDFTPVCFICWEISWISDNQMEW